MAITNITVNCVNLDFNTTGGTDYLRGNIQDNMRIDIGFTTPAPIAEVDFKFNFLPNSTALYPTAGSFKIPDSFFNSPSTGDLQSWRGGLGVLQPNNVKKWRQGLVRFLDLGGNNYSISVQYKINPLILFSDINNGVLDVSSSGYAGFESFKPIFEINCYTNIGDAVPVESTQNNDLGGDFFSTNAIKWGQVGYLDEYLNGNQSIYEIIGYQDTESSIRALLSHNTGSFNATDKVIIKFQRVVNEFDNALDLDENLLYFEFDCLADGILTPVSDDRIDNITATIISGNLQIFINFNPAFFFGVSNYAITATVGVTGVAESTHERTTALIRFKSFEYPFSEDIFELRRTDGIEKALFYNQKSLSVNNASDNVEGYPEDVQLLKFKFGIKQAVYSIDEASLTSFRIVLKDDNGNFEVRSFITSQNIDQSKGLYLLDTDEMNRVKFSIEDEENYIDNTGLKVLSSNTLQGNADGSFILDGFAIGDSVTLTGDIALSSTITALTATEMTLADSIPVQYIGNYWTVNIDNTVVNVDYTNFPATGVYNYKIYTVAYPFVIAPEWVNRTGLELSIEMGVTQNMPDGTVQSDIFQYNVNDFIIYDYDQVNTIDTTITGSTALSNDGTFSVLSPNVFDDQDTHVRSTFVQTGLASLLGSAIGYNNINIVGGGVSTNEYFSSLNPNKSGKYGSGLAVLDTSTADNIRVTSVLDYTLLDGINYRLSSRLFLDRGVFIFFTIIDPLVDGNFDPQIIGGTNSKFTFEDGSFISANSISTAGNGLDGTVQAVVFTWDTTDVSDVLIASDKIYGTLDLRAFNNSSAVGLEFIFDFNDDITEVFFPSNIQTNLSRVRMQDCDGIKELDFTPFGDKFSGQIDFRSGALLERVTFPATTQTVLNIIGLSCTGLAITGIDVSPMTNYCNIDNHQTRFDSCDLSAEQVNKVLIDMDTISTGGFTGRSVIIGGSNSAPTGAGITAKNNLITKGFTVTTS